MRFLCAVVFLMLGVVRVGCAGVIFDLRDQAAVFDGETSALFSLGGITGTFQATGGTLNSNKTVFGIDGTVTGEVAAAIESPESLSITFDQPVFVTGLDLINFDGVEEMQLTIGSNPVRTLQDNGSDIYAFVADNFLPQGASLLFEPSQGNFGIETFTVAAVPEPRTYCVTLLVILAFLGPAFRPKRASC